MGLPWNVGDRPLIEAHITNAAGAYVDPDNLSIKIKDPAGAIVTREYGADADIIRLSTGIYTFHIQFTLSGNWYYYVFTTGSKIVANEGTLSVRSSNVV